MNGTRVQVADASAVGEARRCAAALARQVGFDDAQAGRLALVVTEAGTNLVKHAGGGEILLESLHEDAVRAIHMLALDRGPGIADLGAALRDGFSSGGTPGNGLGAIVRLSSSFDVFSRRGGGSAVFARIDAAAPPALERGLVVGAVNVPHPGETACGDAWAAVRRGRSGMIVLVVDGLGHGAPAHAAARAAAVAFREHAAHAPAEVLTRIHEALRPTRGAAVAVAEVDPSAGRLRFAGVGNIAGTIVANGATRSVVSMHGTAGHDVRRIQEFTYPWPRQAHLVLHSDGLTSRWTLENYPGLLERHPMLIAGVLYRDFRRGRDDTTVVVVRNAV